MIDFFLTFSIQIAVIAGLVLAFKKCGFVDVDLKWSAFSVVLFICYFAALFFTSELISIDSYFPDASYNWVGKFGAILLWLVALFGLISFNKEFKMADAGFTFRQNPNSIKPALCALLAFIVFQITLSSAMGGDAKYTAEDLFFQATMPGLDEEPMFRGILLYAVSLAIISTRFNVLGANINVAGMLLVLLFSLVHGFMYINGEFVFMPLYLFITGFYGFILLWMRERTGSLIFPIVAHNSVNLVGQFF